MKDKKKQKELKDLLKPSHGLLADKEVQLLQKQIRENSFIIDHYIHVIDLLANKERCPKDANTLLALRKRLSISMEENDNFRKVLWKHLQIAEHWKTMPDNVPDPLSFVLNCIRTRKNSLIAQACWK